VTTAPTKWWGASWGATGFACLGYDWIYIPLCSKVLGIEPWSLTAYGATMLVIGIIINLVQLAAGLRPSPQRT
jgi:hypothetical protein